MTAALDASLAEKIPALDRALAERLFAEFREIGFDGVGVSRETYGEGESRALDLMERIAREEGLETGRDRAGNLTIDLPGTEPTRPAIWTGSHLDSVPQGGNFDGAAGAVAALLAAIALKRGGWRPAAPIRAIGLRGEESAWYGQCYLGSSALFGRLAAEDLARRHRDTGRTLAEAMEAVGVDMPAIQSGQALVDPERIGAFLEVHIEQGPVMVARDLPVAMVTGIRGNIRHHEITCFGEAGHSGAVPRWLRHDAVLATAELLARMDEQWRVLLERGFDLVMTTGILGTDPKEHAMSRIPGRCSFSFEVRSQSDDTLDAFVKLLEAEARLIAEQRGVRFEFDVPSRADPAQCEPRILDVMTEVFRAEGLPPERMPSGAGHDSAVFAQAGVPTAMLFVRNRNGSHNPHEEMEIDDFMAAARILTGTLMKLAA